MEWATLLNPKRVRTVSSVKKMSNDGRSEFKKDFDTVCNCPSLRRLQDKAQVFPLEREDYARTRLTHSIEVMSIAESLGVEAVNVIHSKGSYSEDVECLLSDIPTILRVAAFLHDMGNPPFGHLGEEIIADWFKANLRKLRFDNSHKVVFAETHSTDSEMLIDKLNDQMREDFYHFEGNAQLLRLVTRLSNVVDENGMNLTFPVLATIVKYPTKSTGINPTKGIHTKKMGFMYSEADLYDIIDKQLGLGGKRHPLVYLLEAADDIAYLTADIEDAHKKGMISLPTFLNILNSNKNDLFIKDILTECNKYEDQWKVTPVTEHDNYIMQRLRIFIKGKMISAVKDAFAANYKDILDGVFNKELLTVSEANKLSETIRSDIERKYIYYSTNITKTKLQSYQILNALLDRFVLCVFNTKEIGTSDDQDTLAYSLLSNNYRYVCETSCRNRAYNERDNIYYKLLLVTDCISGMTDTYAKDMYQMLTSIKC